MVGSGQFGVNRICKLTGISKATYYAARNPEERFKEKYFNIKRFVEVVIEGHPAYGIRRIKKELWEKHQVEVGRDTLGKKKTGVLIKSPILGISKITGAHRQWWPIDLSRLHHNWHFFVYKDNSTEPFYWKSSW